MSNLSYRTMSSQDFDALLELWEHTPGVDITAADSPTGFRSFLDRNPKLSFVATVDDRIIAGLMCGHDGRRGFIHHLVVIPEFRRQGVASMLVDKSLNKLEQLGIEKCHLFIRRDNPEGLAFWESIGWKERLELTMASYVLEKG